MTPTCRICGVEIPYAGGRPKVVCGSPECRRENRRRVRGSGENYPEGCVWCRLPLPKQINGTPRLYCSQQCQKDHWTSRWADYYARLRSKHPLDGLPEELQESCTLSIGRDRPLSQSNMARWLGEWRLDGNCDFNPKMFADEDGLFPEWLTKFLEEFGACGPDPGMSRGQGQDYALDLEKDHKMWWTKGSMAT